MTKLIDIHTHLHPPRLFAAIRRWFAEHSEWHLTQPTEPNLVAEALEQHGVEKFIFFSYAHKKGMANDINKWLINTSMRLGGYGKPLATVHPGDNDYASYYEDALRNGCLGIKIHEDVQNVRMDHSCFDPIYELTIAYNAFVLVHVGAIPWSLDTEQGPDRVESVLRRYPRLSIVVAHMGAPDTLRYLALTKQFPQLRLDTTMALSTASSLHHAISNEVLVEYHRNILFGSDFPNLPYPYGNEYEPILALPETVQEAILWRNAHELLNL